MHASIPNYLMSLNSLLIRPTPELIQRTFLTPFLPEITTRSIFHSKLEEVDNQTDRYPEVRFLDGDSEFVAKTGSVVSTGDGKSWEAKLDASDLPDDKENFLGVRIIVYDEVGNKMTLQSLKLKSGIMSP